MLTYTLNNKPFLLNSDTSVRLTWINPACNTDNFKGDKGMGIDIPVNDTNRALLGNPERFEKYANSNDREFPNFEIRYSGKLLMSGTLIINSANNEQYSGWLRSEVGNIKKEFQEKYIADIEAFDEDVEFDNKSNYDPLSDPYCTPVFRNTKFFYDKGRTVDVPTQVKNPDWYEGSRLDEYTVEDIETSVFDIAFRNTTYSFVNDKPTVLSPQTFNVYDVEKNLDLYVISPMLFLNYLLKEIFRNAHFFVDRNDIADDPALRTLFVYNNFDIGTFTYQIDESTYRVTRNPYDDSIESVDYVAYEMVRDYPAFKYKWLLPKVKLPEFLTGLQNLLNLCFHFRQDQKVDIIDREKILSTPAFDLQKYMVGQWDMDERKDVTLKFCFEHDKDDTFFQEQWEDLDDRRDDMKEPVETWDNLQYLFSNEIGEIRFVKASNIYAEYALLQLSFGSQISGTAFVEDVLGWKRISYGFQNAFYNRAEDKEEEEIKTNIGTLYTNENYTIVDQPGNTRGKRFSFQNFSTRLAFHNSSSTMRCSNIDKTYSLMLDWQKEDIGLLDARYKNWARFWATRQPASRKAILPLNVLSYIIRNICFPYTCREGDFIIEKIETTIHAHHIGVSTLNVFKK